MNQDLLANYYGQKAKKNQKGGILFGRPPSGKQQVAWLKRKFT
jgi:hypothetical protein